MKNLKLRAINQKQLKLVEKEINGLTLDDARKCSMAAAQILDWILVVLEYARLNHGGKAAEETKQEEGAQKPKAQQNESIPATKSTLTSISP